MTDHPEPTNPGDPRGHLLDDWRPTPEQLSTLAGFSAAYLNGDIAAPRELLRACRKPHAAQLVLAMLQLLDECQTGDRDVLVARLQSSALLYAERDAQCWSNRIDGQPQFDWSEQ